METREVDKKGLLHALDEFCQWVVDHYRLDESTIEREQSPSNPEGALDGQPSPWANKLNEAQSAIMEVIGETSMSAEEIAEKAGYSIDTVRRHLPTLVTLGAIKKHSRGRGYHK
jgi:predicted HTH transcriptional regulator